MFRTHLSIALLIVLVGSALAAHAADAMLPSWEMWRSVAAIGGSILFIIALYSAWPYARNLEGDYKAIPFAVFGLLALSATAPLWVRLAVPNLPTTFTNFAGQLLSWSAALGAVSYVVVLGQGLQEHGPSEVFYHLGGGLGHMLARIKAPRAVEVPHGAPFLFSQGLTFFAVVWIIMNLFTVVKEPRAPLSPPPVLWGPAYPNDPPKPLFPPLKHSPDR